MTTEAAVGQGCRDRLGDPARLLLAGWLIDQVHDTAATQQVLDELEFGVGWPDPEQVDVDREDLVEPLAIEGPPDLVDIGQVELLEDGLARGDMVGVAFGRALDRGRGAVDGGLVARWIAVAERSMAVRCPSANCPQTSDTDTPGPGPISRTSSAGAMSSNCTAHGRRSGTLGLAIGRG